jgi:hypothetical protein
LPSNNGRKAPARPLEESNQNIKIRAISAPIAAAA